MQVWWKSVWWSSHLMKVWPLKMWGFGEGFLDLNHSTVCASDLFKRVWSSVWNLYSEIKTESSWVLCYFTHYILRFGWMFGFCKAGSIPQVWLTQSWGSLDLIYNKTELINILLEVIPSPLSVVLFLIRSGQFLFVV